MAIPSHLGPGQVWHVSAGGLDGRVAAEGPVVATWGDNWNHGVIVVKYG